jgi:hypothetical protein
MKLFAEEMLARKKIVLIFFPAILLRALVVGTMSLGAFSKRREAVKMLLESNLWISGESALRSVEAALLEHEKEALQAENFVRLSGPESPSLPSDRPAAVGGAYSAHFRGTPFLLDSEYRIVVPKKGRERLFLSSAEEIAPESEFSKAFRRAETYEFSQKNFVRKLGTVNWGRSCFLVGINIRVK